MSGEESRDSVESTKLGGAIVGMDCWFRWACDCERVVGETGLVKDDVGTFPLKAFSLCFEMVTFTGPGRGAGASSSRSTPCS